MKAMNEIVSCEQEVLVTEDCNELGDGDGFSLMTCSKKDIGTISTQQHVSKSRKQDYMIKSILQEHDSSNSRDQKSVSQSKSQEQHARNSRNQVQHVRNSRNQEQHVRSSRNQEQHVRSSRNQEQHVRSSRNLEQNVIDVGDVLQLPTAELTNSKGQCQTEFPICQQNYQCRMRSSKNTNVILKGCDIEMNMDPSNLCQPQICPFQQSFQSLLASSCDITDTKPLNAKDPKNAVDVCEPEIFEQSFQSQFSTQSRGETFNQEPFVEKTNKYYEIKRKIRSYRPLKRFPCHFKKSTDTKANLNAKSAKYRKKELEKFEVEQTMKEVADKTRKARQPWHRRLRSFFRIGFNTTPKELKVVHRARKKNYKKRMKQLKEKYKNTKAKIKRREEEIRHVHRELKRNHIQREHDTFNFAEVCASLAAKTITVLEHELREAQEQKEELKEEIIRLKKAHKNRCNKVFSI